MGTSKRPCGFLDTKNTTPPENSASVSKLMGHGWSDARNVCVGAEEEPRIDPYAPGRNSLTASEDRPDACMLITAERPTTDLGDHPSCRLQVKPCLVVGKQEMARLGCPQH